jgi:hypothetical protein
MADDAGGIRSFYRHHGAPCAAPVSGNVECPNCHATRAFRDPLYGMPSGLDPEEPASHPLFVPRQRVTVEGSPAPVRRAVCSRFKFSAVVTLETAGRSRRQYPSGAAGLMLRAPSGRRPTQHQYFPAVVYTDDERPLRPGDKGIPVTISVPDDDASGFFQPGRHFTVWDGTDIGHGTVAQRLFFQWP